MIREDLTVWSLAGWKGSGKTQLLCELIRRLPGRCAVCLVSPQRLHHAAADDSAVFKDAGASHVFRLEERIISMLTGADGITDAQRLRSFLPGSLPVDFLLAEGMLLSGSITAILYTSETARRGLYPGHERASVLIHDGRQPACSLIDAHKRADQRLLFRKDYPEMLEMLVGRPHK